MSNNASVGVQGTAKFLFKKLGSGPQIKKGSEMLTYNKKRFVYNKKEREGVEWLSR